MNQKVRAFFAKPVVQFIVGLLGGLLMPLAFATLFYTSFYHGDDELKLVIEFFRQSKILPKFILVSMIPNFISIFLLNMFERWNYLRGVFVAVMVYLSLAFLL